MQLWNRYMQSLDYRYVMATAHHRTVIFDCEATVCEDAMELAAQQTRLLARYQPEGGFRPLAPDDSLYRGAIAHLAAVRLHLQSQRVEFKLGQNRPVDAREKIVEQLCKRRRPNDARAAVALQWTIDRDATRGPRVLRAQSGVKTST